VDPQQRPGNVMTKSRILRTTLKIRYFLRVN
jgi:hypothetical protein